MFITVVSATSVRTLPPPPPTPHSIDLEGVDTVRALHANRRHRKRNQQPPGRKPKSLKASAAATPNNGNSDVDSDASSDSNFVSREDYDKQMKVQRRTDYDKADPPFRVIDRNRKDFVIPYDDLPVLIGFYGDDGDGETKKMENFLTQAPKGNTDPKPNRYPWDLRDLHNFSPGECK